MAQVGPLTAIQVGALVPGAGAEIVASIGVPTIPGARRGPVTRVDEPSASAPVVGLGGRHARVYGATETPA